MYASAVAVSLFERSQLDPKFGSEYEGLLRRGFDADPVVLVASIKINLDDPELIRWVARLIDELKQLCDAEENN